MSFPRRLWQTPLPLNGRSVSHPFRYCQAWTWHLLPRHITTETPEYKKSGMKGFLFDKIEDRVALCMHGLDNRQPFQHITRATNTAWPKVSSKAVDRLAGYDGLPPRPELGVTLAIDMESVSFVRMLAV
jgi:hypothetical protein